MCFFGWYSFFSSGATCFMLFLFFFKLFGSSNVSVYRSRDKMICGKNIDLFAAVDDVVHHHHYIWILF